MAKMNVIETSDVDSFDDSEWEDLDLRATILHHDDNRNQGEPNKHAVIVGETVVVLETDE